MLHLPPSLSFFSRCGRGRTGRQLEPCCRVSSHSPPTTTADLADLPAAPSITIHHHAQLLQDYKADSSCRCCRCGCSFWKFPKSVLGVSAREEAQRSLRAWWYSCRSLPSCCVRVACVRVRSTSRCLPSIHLVVVLIPLSSKSRSLRGSAQMVTMESAVVRRALEKRRLSTSRSRTSTARRRGRIKQRYRKLALRHYPDDITPRRLKQNKEVMRRLKMVAAPTAVGRRSSSGSRRPTSSCWSPGSAGCADLGAGRGLRF